MKLDRDELKQQIFNALRRSRSVGLIGPRQCGKSTLAKEIATEQGESHYFDLEDPGAAARLSDPKLALQDLTGLVVIDEVQRRPDLLPLLRVLLDRNPLPARFLLLGSASPLLVQGASESLAGRIEFIEMRGFSIAEVGSGQMKDLWFRGGLPPSFLAGDDLDSLKWRESYLQSFVERDLRQLGVDLPPAGVRRFLSMLAHLHGQVWNASELGRSLQMAHTTARRYLDVLTGALLLRTLPPWFENVGKRLVKSPKVYVRDSGLLHALLGFENLVDLESHPKLGPSWEGFALENVLSWTGDRHAYFWATHAGAEVDLCWMRGKKRIGVEFKYSSAPSTTRSMHIALNDLHLDHLYVVHPGREQYPLSEKISAIGLEIAKTVFCS